MYCWLSHTEYCNEIITIMVDGWFRFRCTERDHAGGFSGGFSVKMWGAHAPWGKGGEKMMEMLTEVCTRVFSCFSQIILSPHTFGELMRRTHIRSGGIWNWAKIWGAPTSPLKPGPYSPIRTSQMYCRLGILRGKGQRPYFSRGRI